MGAQTNLSYNCLDRHIEHGMGDRVAFYFEGNDIGQESTVTYKQLLAMVCKIANHLRSIGVKQGSDVTIYMPMVPELPAAMVSVVATRPKAPKQQALSDCAPHARTLFYCAPRGSLTRQCCVAAAGMRKDWGCALSGFRGILGGIARRSHPGL